MNENLDKKAQSTLAKEEKDISIDTGASITKDNKQTSISNEKIIVDASRGEKKVKTASPRYGGSITATIVVYQPATDMDNPDTDITKGYIRVYSDSSGITNTFNLEERGSYFEASSQELYSGGEGYMVFGLENVDLSLPDSTGEYETITFEYEPPYSFGPGYSETLEANPIAKITYYDLHYFPGEILIPIKPRVKANFNVTIQGNPVSSSYKFGLYVKMNNDPGRGTHIQSFYGSVGTLTFTPKPGRLYHYSLYREDKQSDAPLWDYDYISYTHDSLQSRFNPQVKIDLGMNGRSIFISNWKDLGGGISTNDCYPKIKNIKFKNTRNGHIYSFDWPKDGILENSFTEEITGVNDVELYSIDYHEFSSWHFVEIQSKADQTSSEGYKYILFELLHTYYENKIVNYGEFLYQADIPCEFKCSRCGRTNVTLFHETCRGCGKERDGSELTFNDLIRMDLHQCPTLATCQYVTKNNRFGYIIPTPDGFTNTRCLPFKDSAPKSGYEFMIKNNTPYNIGFTVYKNGVKFNDWSRVNSSRKGYSIAANSVISVIDPSNSTYEVMLDETIEAYDGTNHQLKIESLGYMSRGMRYMYTGRSKIIKNEPLSRNPQFPYGMIIDLVSFAPNDFNQRFAIVNNTSYYFGFAIYEDNGSGTNIGSYTCEEYGWTVGGDYDFHKDYQSPTPLTFLIDFTDAVYTDYGDDYQPISISNIEIEIYNKEEEKWETRNYNNGDTLSFTTDPHLYGSAYGTIRIKSVQ